jgi:hypothetical protein
MACCAFAVLVVSQLLAPFVWVRRRLFGEPAKTNAVVAWSLTSSRAAANDAVPRRISPRAQTLWYAAVAIELAIGAAALGYVAPARTGTAWVEAAAFDGAWCRGIANMLRGTSDGIDSE